jgi:alpha-beta hydrolase superfamily lysophospholipase
LVHGLSEHSGRYDHVGSYLAERGVEVHAYDHLGHGRSGGQRGWVARFDDFLDDLALIHADVDARAPRLPVFMLGHSMGGLIVTAYLLARSAKPDFVVLSGPAIAPIFDPGDRRIEPSRLSRDPAVWDAYMSDPLILRERVTDELFVRLAEGLALLPGNAGSINLPILLLHGTDDPLCSAEGAQEYLTASASSDLSVRLYEGGRHEMFNEINRQEVLGDLWSWMSERIER